MLNLLRKIISLLLISTLGISICHTKSIAGVKPNFPKDDENKVIVGLVGNQYFIVDAVNKPLPDRQSNNFGAQLSWRSKSAGNTLEGLIDLDTQIGITNSNFKFLNPNEFYLGTSPALSNEYSVHLGRKIEEWNTIDDYWSTGLFQPRFRWDYLSERTSGLMGIFGSVKKENFAATLFLSPIFLPEQGAPQNFTDGQCQSGSPWFYCPSNNINLFNQPTAVSMRIEMPPITKLIAYAGVGASIKLGGKEGTYLRSSVAHKPMNQIFLAYDGQLDLSTQVLPAVIHPRVLYHTLYATELGFKKNKDLSVLSVMREEPVHDYVPAQWNAQDTSRTTIFGALLSRELIGEGKYATQGELSYFYRDGGSVPDRGPFATSNGSVFEPRFAFQNAVSAKLKSPIFRDWATNFQAAVKFIYDTNNKGNILMADLLFTPAPKLKISIGFDMLGSNSNSAIDFISRYQRNDRIRGGLHYYF